MSATRFKVGDLVRVAEGAGIDSGKQGYIIPRSEVPHQYVVGVGNIPDIEGAYRPMEKDEFGIRADDGEIFVMFKSSLVKLDPELERCKDEAIAFTEIHRGAIEYFVDNPQARCRMLRIIAESVTPDVCLRNIADEFEKITHRFYDSRAFADTNRKILTLAEMLRNVAELYGRE